MSLNDQQFHISKAIGLVDSSSDFMADEYPSLNWRWKIVKVSETNIKITLVSSPNYLLLAVRLVYFTDLRNEREISVPRLGT